MPPQSGRLPKITRGRSRFDCIGKICQASPLPYWFSQCRLTPALTPPISSISGRQLLPENSPKRPSKALTFISITSKLDQLNKAPSGVKVAALVIAATTIIFLVTRMGNLCCWPRSGRELEPAPPDAATKLYEDGASAWVRYVDKGKKPSDLAETIQKANEALDAAERDHPQRNEILLILIFALLEQNLDQSSLEKIERYFSELEGWNGLENGRKADARAISEKLATQYHESYNQAPSDSDFERCLSNYTRVRKYSDKLEDRTNANLKIATLHQQRGQFEAAMGIIDNGKSACPPDRPDLLSSICMTKFMLHQDIYRNTGSSQELENAVTEGELALQVQFDMPHPQRAMLLTGVAQSICALSEAQPGEVDFEGRIRDAIRYARESARLNPEEENSPTEASIALADALSSRRIKPTIPELDEAMALYRKAKDSEASRGDQELLSNLANAICFRCEKEGEDRENGTTLQSAVELYEEALEASSDHRWNSRIVNNIACIYIDKAKKTNDEVDYENARDNYLKAANYLEEVEAESDPGDANDVDYYRSQAEAIAETIARLKEGFRGEGSRHSSERKPTQRRRSTPRSPV